MSHILFVMRRISHEKKDSNTLCINILTTKSINCQNKNDSRVERQHYNRRYKLAIGFIYV